MEVKDLIVVEKLNPVELFTGTEKIEPFLADIEKKVMAHVADISTAQGRKDIASLAYKVAQSKTLLDGLGKELVADWKQKAKKVDASRKYARDFLDDLRDKARQPLTEWEEAEKARIEAEERAREKAKAHEEALAENALFDRQKEVERREAEIAKAEEERRAKEEAERLAKEQAERDERIRKEAEERAKREAEEAAARQMAEAQAAAERAEKERIEAAERAEREKREAVEAAERKAREEAARAEEERQAKEAAAKAEAERIERERLEKEEAERIAAEKKAANKRHRAKVDAEAARSIQGILGTTEEQAKGIVAAISSGAVPHVSIRY